MRRALTVLAVLAVAATATAAPAAAAPRPLASPVVTAPANPPDEYVFTGHGWGHGRGMGQYGALGYAVTHGWDYRRILDHYYGGTTLGTEPAQTIDVELLTHQGNQVVVAGNGLMVNGTAVPGDGLDVVQVVRTGTNQLAVSTGTRCEGAPWTPLGTYSGSVELTVPRQDRVEDLVRTCVPGDRMRAYRGSIVVHEHAQTGANRAVVVNRVDSEHYLLGVVPRESPDSWGTLGGGKGLEALKAQTVAARSYALAGGLRPSGAKTCDTISCQVYLGAAEIGWVDGAYRITKNLDALAPNTAKAVPATRGEVRRTSSGAVARTEFSSSTGGYTAGGAFPAVPDEGDATPSNPNHTWKVTLTADQLEARLGLPPGRLASIAVTGRSGLGAEGGRVTELTWVGTDGSVHRRSARPEQDTIRSLLGLKSNWFTISGSARSAAEKVVRALYADVLGRSVDPTGLRTWTDYILATGDRASLVRQIATSRERMEKLVAGLYRQALNRGPEPEGLNHWVRHFERGLGVYDLQIGIFGSPEALSKLGGGNVDTWVGALYTRLLGRASTAPERAFWVDIANRRGREAVVAGIAQSDEATMRRLTDYYRTFLLRGVDPSGRATFLPLMTARGDFDIPVHLGSSPEYWNRAQSRF